MRLISALVTLDNAPFSSISFAMSAISAAVVWSYSRCAASAARTLSSLALILNTRSMNESFALPACSMILCFPLFTISSTVMPSSSSSDGTSVSSFSSSGVNAAGFSAEASQASRASFICWMTISLYCSTVIPSLASNSALNRSMSALCWSAAALASAMRAFAI